MGRFPKTGSAPTRRLGRQNRRMNPLVVTVGPPASGKTTWAQAQRSVVVVSLDDLRDPGHWTPAAHRRALGYAFARIRAAPRDRAVVFDSTAVNAYLRADLRALAADLGRPAWMADFRAVPVAALEVRNATRSTRVPADDLRAIVERFAPQRPELEPWARIIVAASASGGSSKLDG
jgi:predicted kinase